MSLSPKELLRALFDEAVIVADPISCLEKHLPPPPAGRLIVIGAGKASARMAEAVERHYKCDIEGLVITRYGYARPTKHIEIVEAAHPVPDQAGVDATRRMLALVGDLRQDDLVLALISGGGSALLCAPIDGISLEDKQQINQNLLASGAPISEMNVVRRHFSAVKGGKLAIACAPARVCGLVISDVAGDDLNIIASGPTVPSQIEYVSIIPILEKWSINIDPHILRIAERHNSPEVPQNEVTNRIVAAPSQSLEAAKALAQSHGCDVKILGDAIEGEARTLGAEHTRLAMDIAKTRTKTDKPLLLLSGGECTVTRTGDGIGGPNAEYALSALIALNGAQNIHLLAADTDGVDGAAEVAGAFVSPSNREYATELGLDAQSFLERNDAHTFFEKLGEQLVTGPTLTNVNDFRAILIG